MVQVLVPKERRSGETRVAATPETVKKMVKEGLAVSVERGAGEAAYFSDADYEAAGAVLSDAPDWSAADVVLKVAPFAENESPKSGALAIGLFAPHGPLDRVRRLVAGNVTTLSMELVPRITRAQGMDALSSQASIAGYKAVLLAAVHLPKYLPLLMTAAGTIKPAKIVIMGAGVAGLQAIGTARRLGAVVEVSDVRPEVKEQVESLGARFIELPMLEQESGAGTGGYARQMGEDFLRRQREIVRDRLTTADAAITTALVPGRKAPTLLTREMVEAMRPGSVIIDLAVEQGGNCELSQADQEVVHQGVRILGPSNLPATLPHDASTLYARNVLALLLHVTKKGEMALDPEEEIVKATLLTHAGGVVHAPTAERLASETES
ncbi:MAG TPA: Re/Si-specific NAD(P)(+) transhydrogenase subunit alpha [Thermoanaerobaculia bacterium]|jgi:NAD(P) transhydrogenase subunit alpha|nr:Re/Si-specific NAD(P)(+) transhydrogenase subunit alpha [Thermoanaerobaculia bacterium]